MTDNFNNKPNPEVVDNSGPSITHGDSEIGFEATSKKPDNVSTAPRNFSFGDIRKFIKSPLFSIALMIFAVIYLHSTSTNPSNTGVLKLPRGGNISSATPVLTGSTKSGGTRSGNLQERVMTGAIGQELKTVTDTVKDVKDFNPLTVTGAERDALIVTLENEANAPGTSSDWDIESEYLGNPDQVRATNDPLDAVYTFFRKGNGRPLQEGLLTTLRDNIRIDKCSQNGKTGRTFVCDWTKDDITTVKDFLSQSEIFKRPGSALKQYENINSGVRAQIFFGSGKTLISIP